MRETVLGYIYATAVTKEMQVKLNKEVSMLHDRLTETSINRRSFLALGLASATAWALPKPAYAEDVADETAVTTMPESAPFGSREPETCTIDGVEYRFTYSTTDSGDNQTTILNLSTGESFVIVFSQDEGVVRIDGVTAGYIDPIMPANWVSMGSSSFYISREAAFTVAAFAGAMITVIGGSTPVAVVVAYVGAKIIENIIEQAGDTKVSYTLYYERYDPYVDYAANTTFSKNGRSWGPYWIPWTF